MIRIGVALSALILLFMAGVSVFGFLRIPEGAELPSHWNLKGEIDGYAPRDLMLVLTPIAAMALAALFSLLPMIDPRKENVRASGGLYITAWLGALLLLAIVHAVIVLGAAFGAPVADMMPNILLYAASALMIVLGNFTAKSRSSFFLGVRTPWTLSSEHSWSVTNRAAGWMLVMTGLAAMAAGYFGDAGLGLLVGVAGALATLAMSIVISYFAWAADPERRRA
jgi:uncharacterized membrane protein